MPFAEGTPTASVTLDKPRELAFTIGAMRRAKELGVLAVNVEDPTALMLAMPEYVWACLSDKDRKELSVEAIAELISPHNIVGVTEAIGSLFKSSMPEDTSGNAQPAAVETPTAGNSTSISSGELAGTISG